jgi:hypothetical protein
MTYPRIINSINDKLVLNQQAPLSEDDFTRPDDRALWRQLPRSGDGWSVADGPDLWDSFEEEFLQTRVEALLSLPETPESELDRLPEKLVLSVLEWRLEVVKELTVNVERLFLEAQAQNDPDLIKMYRQQLRELPKQRRSIDRAREAMSAVGRRNAGSATGRYHKQMPIDGTKGD